MFRSVLIALTVVGVPALAAATALDTQRPASPARPGEMQMAQACGWYAIMLCSRSHGDAQRWSSNYDVGYVVDTSSNRYPNFAPGWYCVVEGPMSQGRAQATANSYRDISRQAYVKNAC